MPRMSVLCPVCGRSIGTMRDSDTIPAAHNKPDGSRCPREQLLIPERFARMFGRVLLEWIGKLNMKHVIDLNKTSPPYKDGSACASHEYCDANVAMAEAWQRLGVRDAVSMKMLVYDEAKKEGKTDEQADRLSEAAEALPSYQRAVDLWNDAWVLAKANDFFLKPADLKMGPTGPGWE